MRWRRTGRHGHGGSTPVPRLRPPISGLRGRAVNRADACVPPLFGIGNGSDVDVDLELQAARPVPAGIPCDL